MPGVRLTGAAASRLVAEINDRKKHGSELVLGEKVV
jgi:hypothetical protein